MPWMTENNRPVVLSTANLIGLRLVDGGDTVALRFEAPDGREVAILIPRDAASELDLQLGEVLARPWRSANERL
jgi:hypothetical protein